MSEYQMRNATLEDLPRIVAIYNASIPGRLATADLVPVTIESRMPWFNAHRSDKYPLIVAEQSGEILGWASLSQFYGRIAYQYTAEISVYIDPAHGRKGVATALIDEMLARCPKLQVKTLLAFIFGHNDPSLRLFKQKGFVRWACLPKIADMEQTERDLEIWGLRVY